MPISPQSVEFLLENHIKNSRDWFKENRPRYQTLVETPMLQLAEALGPAMQEIDPLLVVQPRRCLSRIWLDMRVNRSGMFFRDHVWLSFKRGKGMVYPAFYFEFSPRGYSYGMGYYAMPPGVLDILRGWVLKGDARYLAAQKALDALPTGFHISGEEYKRKKYPDAPPSQQPWLNRKCLSVTCEGRNAELLFSEKLGDLLKEAFSKLAPIYQFFLKAHLLAEAE